MASASGLQKPLTPSAELAAVIVPGPHTRAEATMFEVPKHINRHLA
jgi:hypothetical protein